MIRLLVILLTLFLVNAGTINEASAQYKYNPNRNGGQRYCYNPNCPMCNQIWGPMPGYQLTSDYRSVRIQSNNTTRINPVSNITQPVAQSYTVVNPIQPKLMTKKEADTALLPTSHNVVTAVLELVKPGPDDWVYDLGCGDGRIVIEAAKKYGAKAVGIEINPESAKKAMEAVRLAGVQDKVLIVEGDVLKHTYENADIITLYLYPDLIEKIVPLIQPGTTVISISHDIPGIKTNKRIIEVDGVDYEFFIWKT